MFLGQNGQGVGEVSYSSAQYELFRLFPCLPLSVARAANYNLISSPKICKAMPSLLSFWNGVPQFLTGLFAPISDCISNDLSCLSTKCNPDPCLVRFFEDKRCYLIELHVCLLWVISIRFQECFTQRRQDCYLFLIHFVTVLRSTPNVLFNPRKLLRS